MQLALEDIKGLVRYFSDNTEQLAERIESIIHRDLTDAEYSGLVASIESAIEDVLIPFEY